MIQKATQEHITIRFRGRKMPSRKKPVCRSKSKFRNAMVSFRNPLEIFLRIWMINSGKNVVQHFL